MDCLVLGRIIETLESRGAVYCIGYPKMHLDAALIARLSDFGYLGAPTEDGPPDDARVIFSRFGFPRFKCIDISDYEGAELVMNFAQDDVPLEARGKADLLIDPGTFEHFDNIPQAMKNAHDLLADNGVIFHINPGNGWYDHGFWQVSPTFYHDYYRTNGYSVVVAAVHVDLGIRGQELVQYRHDIYRTSGRPWIMRNMPSVKTIFAARKLPGATANVPTVQTYYRDMSGQPRLDYRTEIEVNISLRHNWPQIAARLAKQSAKKLFGASSRSTKN